MNSMPFLCLTLSLFYVIVVYLYCEHTNAWKIQKNILLKRQNAHETTAKWELRLRGGYWLESEIGVNIQLLNNRFIIISPQPGQNLTVFLYIGP